MLLCQTRKQQQQQQQQQQKYVSEQEFFITYRNRKQNNRLVSDGNNSEKIFPLQRRMYVKFNIYTSFKLTRKKLHTPISGLVIGAFFVSRELIVVMSTKEI